MSDPPINLPPIQGNLQKPDQLKQEFPPYQPHFNQTRPRLNPPPKQNPTQITLPGVSTLSSHFNVNPMPSMSSGNISGPPLNVPMNPPVPQKQIYSQSLPSRIDPPKAPSQPIQPKAPEGSSNAEFSRPLNVRDALTYLDQVKMQFHRQPEVYNRFLEIMKDFKSQQIDTPGVIERVSNLFRSQPGLIIGFNTFLPPGYSLELTNNPNDPVRVTTPSSAPYQPASPTKHNFEGNFRGPNYPRPPEPVREEPPAYGNPPPQPTYNSVLQGASNIISSMNPSNSNGESSRMPDPSNRPRGGPMEFNHAINYVNKIKTRFANQPETYRYFLEILQTYQKDEKPISEVYAQVQFLFSGAPDLLEEFKQFLPENAPINAPAQPGTQAPPPPLAGIKKQPRRTNAPAPPSHYYPQPIVQPIHPKKKVKVGKNDKLTSAEELEFFDKCKRVIGNKSTYNEFLKLLNLFTQEIIEAKVLIERAEPFLGKSPELFDWFKKFVRYEDDDIIYNIPAEKTPLDLRNCKQSGHSYRKLPNNIPRPICSGRDELAKDVLSDDWVSIPVFVSESGFISHKKTPYEEAMYKCEEERYEFDLNIEANLSVISLLEPIAKKIMLMGPEERAAFKLSPGLGGSSTTIYKRVIKKIYDTDRGLEVIEALHQNPAVAVPIVLKRLKQKDEEWKRSQREWNKVWREIDFKNFSKALDHQGINFKINDRKAILSKTLINEIEVLLQEQQEKKSTLPNRYQFDFVFKNLDIFGDLKSILTSYIENVGGLGAEEEEKMQNFLQDTLASFMNLQKLDLENGEAKSEMEVDQNGDVVENGEKDGNEGDIEEVMDVDESEQGPVDSKKRASNVIYCNNTIYCFFRLYQMLYARLQRMSEISASLSDVPVRSEMSNPVAVELGLCKENSKFKLTLAKAFSEKDRYTELLKDITSFVNGELDSNDFEDKTRELFWTAGYLIFTVDKLVQTLVKQIQTIVGDSKSCELITNYSRNLLKTEPGPRQEALNRLCAEQIIQDENIYRLEYYLGEKVLTMQLLSKEDQITDDTITSEEKWSLYVDQFVQLNASENVALKRRHPFLKRSLPAQVDEDPPLNVETRSGLELKICVNTYKIFFVDNTEDYFRRKVSSPGSLLGLSFEPPRETGNRSAKFKTWLNSSKGWKFGVDDHQAQHLERDFKTWTAAP